MSRAGAAQRRAPETMTWPSAAWWPVGALVALGVALAFLPALAGDFLNVDDQFRFLKNKAYMGLGWAQLRWMFAASFRSMNYEPLTWLTLATVYTLRGADPAAYHLPGYLAHIAAAVLYYLVALRLLATGTTPREGASPPRLAAAFAALLFALHPLRVEAVAWMTGQHYPMAAAFYLGAILLYLRAARAATPSPIPRSHRGPERQPAPPGLASRAPLPYWGSVSLFSVSLLFYSVGMTLPVTLLILDLYPLRRMADDDEPAFPSKMMPLLREKIPFIVLALASFSVTVACRTSADLAAPLEQVGLAPRLQQAGYGLTAYLLKTLDPVHFPPYVMYSVAIPRWRCLAAATAAVALTLAALALRRRCPAFLAAWGHYVVALLPVAGLAQSGNYVADRYTYLPCLSWPLLAGAAVVVLGRQERHRRLLPRCAAAAVSLVAALGVLSWRQCRPWRDSVSFWTATLRFNPDSPLVHDGLADALAQRGDLGPALRHLEESKRLDPGFVSADSTLGLVYAKMGDPTAALRHFRAALAAQPDNPSYLNSVGATLAQLGRTGEAIAHFHQALAFAPGNAEIRFNLGVSLMELGRVPEALAQFRQAVELYPGYWEAHFNAGTLLAGQGRFDEAMRHYRSALSIKPGHPEVLNNLGVALLKTGRAAEAQACFEVILRSRPGHARARFNLARARHHSPPPRPGRVPQAARGE